VTDVERYEPSVLPAHERAGLERDAAMLASSGLVPDYFKGKPNEVLIAGLALRDKGLALTVSTLGMVYVIKGKPGYMSQLQVGLLARHGYDLHPVQGQCDAKSATVEIEARDHTRHQVTFTMEDAVRAKLVDRNEMYKLYPDRMLFARACSKAVGMFHPEILLGFGPVDRDETAAVNTDTIAEGGVSFRPPGQAAGPGLDPGPAPSTRGPGYPPLPEDLASDTERAAILTLLDLLDDDAKAAVRARAHGIGNVKGPRFTRDNAATLLGLINDELAALRSRHHGASPGTVAADAPGVPPTAGAADGGGPAQAPPSASSDDAGRPFE